MSGLVHRHMRVRKGKSPKSGFWFGVLDKATVLAGIIGPAMTIPQIYQIYVLHMASGVSAISWIAFGVLDIVFIIYGIAHKDKPIISTYILWMIMNFVVGIGAVMYR